VRRLLQRRGFDTSGADLPQRDPVAEESPALAGIRQCQKITERI